MEPSRKIIIYAFVVLFVSQFFPYEAIGHTSMIIGRDYFEGGLPTGGRTGWICHSQILISIMAVLAFLFLVKSQTMILYVILLVGFIGMGLGSGIGAFAGEVSILMVLYALFIKAKESKAKKINEENVTKL